MARSEFAFPTTFLINLAKREKRLYTLRRHFKQQNWPVPLERVAGVELKDGAEGFRRSHIITSNARTPNFFA